jgi:hypothetical protein
MRRRRRRRRGRGAKAATEGRTAVVRLSSLQLEVAHIFE